MSNFQDASVGIGVEGTFKTYQAPTRFYEFTDESLDWKKTIKQGQGLRVAGRVPRAGRRVYVAGMGQGDITMEVPSKGLGLLLQALLGTSASTLVSGSTFQQTHALGDTLGSLTIQKGIPQVSGTVDAYSYLGCMGTGFELSMAQNGLLILKSSFDVADITTAQGLAAVSYPASPVNLFGMQNATIQLGGTVTMPTTTAIGSTTSPVSASVRSFQLTYDNNLTTDRFLFGGAGRKAKSTVGVRNGIKGKLTVEYDQTTLRDLFLNDTATSLIFTVTAGALSTGNETFQVVLPSIYLEGDIPNSNQGDLITTDIEFTLTDDLSRAPITIVTRTADAAL